MLSRREFIEEKERVTEEKERVMEERDALQREVAELAGKLWDAMREKIKLLKTKKVVLIEILAGWEGAAGACRL